MRDPRDEEAFEALQPWLAETETGDRAELPLEPSEALWAELVGRLRPLRRPPLPASLDLLCRGGARTRAAEAELVIANHALYFAHLAAGGGVLPEHDAVVFDEAHRLEETAATWLGGRVSRAGLRRLARRRRARLPRGVASRFRRARSTGSSAPASGCSRAVAPPRGRRRLRELPVEDALAPARRARRRSPTSCSGRGEELDLLSRRALAVAAQVEACLDAGGLERVVWAEPDAIAWAPVDVSAELREPPLG